MDRQGYKSVRHAQRLIDLQRDGLEGERVGDGQGGDRGISIYPPKSQHQIRNSPHSLPNIMAFTAVSKGKSI
jgi:hypothetical protein